MLTAAVLVPSPPILVPELNGAGAAETGELRTAALRAAGRLGAVADRWIVLGTGAGDQIVGAGTVGTFKGFGVDVRVSLSPGATAEADPGVPLAALVAGWLRGVAAPAVTLDCRIVAADASPARCGEIGVALRDEVADPSEPVGVLVVADGATTLTPKAPGAFDERAPRLQEQLNTALAQGDFAALAGLDAGLCAELGCSGRAAWQVLAALFGTAPGHVTTDYVDAPFGVGYYVGTWQP